MDKDQIETVSQIEQECIADLERNSDFQRKCWEALEELRTAEKQLQVIVQLASETKNLHHHIIQQQQPPDGRVSGQTTTTTTGGR